MAIVETVAETAFQRQGTEHLSQDAWLFSPYPYQHAEAYASHAAHPMFSLRFSSYPALQVAILPVTACSCTEWPRWIQKKSGKGCPYWRSEKKIMLQVDRWTNHKSLGTLLKDTANAYGLTYFTAHYFWKRISNTTLVGCGIIQFVTALRRDLAQQDSFSVPQLYFGCSYLHLFW